MSLLPPSIQLTLKNRGGSVEHYYHYLLGYLVPLAIAHDELKRSGDSRPIVVRSCALMDRHTDDIEFDGVEIVEKQTHSSLITSEGYAAIECTGFDDPARYCRESLASAAAILTERLSADVARFANELNCGYSSSGPKIVMIDRDPPHPFYQSPDCEIKSAGTARRSIPNFTDLVAAVTSRYPNTTSVTLQDKPLAYQIALFQHADVIISQHGATLANLIWSRPGSHVIEIHPCDLPDQLQQRGFFPRLAECMNLRYHRVDQATCHSNVDIDPLMDCLDEIT